MQVADDIFAYTHPFGANCAVFAFKDGNEVDLLDTGIKWPFILCDLLKKMAQDGIDKRCLRRIVHTHVHFDHVQADRYFQKHAKRNGKDVQVFIPQADNFRFAPNFNEITTQSNHLLQFFPFEAAKYYWGVSLGLNVAFNTIFHYQAPENIVTFNSGDTLALGRYKARVWCTGGHTEGHAILWLPDAPALIVGDNDAINEFTCTFDGILESHRICRDLYSRYFSDDLLLLRGHNAILKGTRGRQWNDQWFQQFNTITTKILPFFQRRYEVGKKSIDIGHIVDLLTGYFRVMRPVEFFAFMRVFVILKFLQKQGVGKMKFREKNLWFEIAPNVSSWRLNF